MIEFTLMHLLKHVACGHVLGQRVLILLLLFVSKSCLIAVHAGDADAACPTRSVGGLALPALLAVAEEEEGGDDGHRDSHGEADHHELVHFSLFYA